MNPKEKLQADLIAAMKRKEEVKVGVLRMIKAAVLKFETSGSGKELDEEAFNEILKKELKMRIDAAEGFKKGGNEEAAQKELDEAEILKGYLPEQMSEDEVRVLAQEILKEMGIVGKEGFGKAMGAVMAKVKGKADGGVVKKVLEGLL